MVVSNVPPLLPPVTRLPRVTSARLARPSTGARTFVNDSMQRRVESSAALAPATFACC